MKGVDEEAIGRSSWSNTFFYQLYSVLFLIGTIPDEMASSLQQLLTVLVAMHTKDPTLEFKNALTPDKLFLNRYPELEQAFHPIAMGLLETMNDALSIGYILEHYFDDAEIVLAIIHKDALLTMIQDKSSRTRYAATLIVPTVRCLNVFNQHEEITPYCATVLAILCSENCGKLRGVAVRRRESAESGDRGARFYDCSHFADPSIHRSVSPKRVSIRADAVGERYKSIEGLKSSRGAARPADSEPRYFPALPERWRSLRPSEVLVLVESERGETARLV